MIVVDRQGNEITKGASQNKLLKRLYGTLPGRCALKLLVCRFVSNIGGAYMNSCLSKHKIKAFIRKYDINMDDYQKADYKSYNDFFTREINPDKRPINHVNWAMISPADAKLTSYLIDEDSTFNIKDTVYNLKDLLQDETLANEYIGGVCLIYRLTVDDYHRYSFVDDGQIIGHKKIPGIFHTVNPIANEYYPIYKQNTREYTIIKTLHFDKIVQMEVGAMMVGRIVNHDIKMCARGQEKGYFEFGGSTVIVLVKKDVIDVDQDIVVHSNGDMETVVKLGEKIATRR